MGPRRRWRGARSSAGGVPLRTRSGSVRSDAARPRRPAFRRRDGGPRADRAGKPAISECGQQPRATTLLSASRAVFPTRPRRQRGRTPHARWSSGGRGSRAAGCRRVGARGVLSASCTAVEPFDRGGWWARRVPDPRSPARRDGTRRRVRRVSRHRNGGRGRDGATAECRVRPSHSRTQRARACSSLSFRWSHARSGRRETPGPRRLRYRGLGHVLLGGLRATRRGRRAASQSSGLWFPMARSSPRHRRCRNRRRLRVLGPVPSSRRPHHRVWQRGQRPTRRRSRVGDDGR